MRRALLALLIALAPAPALARDAVSALDACTGALDPALDVGYEKIAARCPDLAPSLALSPWAEWLPRDWDRAGNNLSSGGLKELRALIVAESRRGPGVEAPQPAHLAAVLAALAPAEHAPRSWWERFKSWLRERLRVREASARPAWLVRVLDALKSRAALIRTVSFAALALVTLLAGAMVVGELRAAGWLRTGRRRRPAAGVAASAAAAADLATIEGAAAAERPRLLLELITARLAALERLPPARALTVRELLQAARLQDAGDRARLAALGEASERLRYSGRELPAETLAAALARGRELLAGLGVAPA